MRQDGTKYIVRGATPGVESADQGWWTDDHISRQNGVCWTLDREKATGFSTLELATAKAIEVNGRVELIEQPCPHCVRGDCTPYQHVQAKASA